MNIITKLLRALLLSSAFAVLSVCLSGCDGWKDENPEDDIGGGGGGNNNTVIGNNNCTSAATCKSKQMPDGRIWMTENLNVATEGSWCFGEGGQATIFIDVDVPTVVTLSSSEVQANCGRYGRLYTWTAAKAACESIGRRLPTREEWDDLVKAAGGPNTAGKALKSTSGWYDSYNGTDRYGFSAMPGGIRSDKGNFTGVEVVGYWWTGTEAVADAGAYYDRSIYGAADIVQDLIGFSNIAHSVRCVGE